MSGLTVVLFQGDSITDAGRDRNDPIKLGWEYAVIARCWLQTVEEWTG